MGILAAYVAGLVTIPLLFVLFILITEEQNDRAAFKDLRSAADENLRARAAEKERD